MKNNPFSLVIRISLLFVIIQGVISGCMPPKIGQDSASVVTEIPSTEQLPLPNVISITAISKPPPSHVTIQTAPVAPISPIVTLTPDLLATQSIVDDSPIIFIGSRNSVNQKCGEGVVVAADGHFLRATPRILRNNSNQLEKLPEGSHVDIIDCRLWTDEDDISWLAVRTDKNKLGWMYVQSDIFNVTVYPVIGSVPQAITGLPSGTKIAYMPPSDCKSGPVTNEGVATSIGIDLIPVVGDVKGLQEAATGCDMVTGESLGNWRWLGLLGLIGLSEVALLRHADEAGDVARLADNARMADRLTGSISYSDEATMALLKNADNAADFRYALKHADDIADSGVDTLRYGANTGGLTDEAVQALAKFDQPCSFSADTPVLTKTGLKPIALMTAGDKVLSFSEKENIQDFFPVSTTFYHNDEFLLQLTINNETILTTPDHPFYSDGVWVAAGDLAVGDRIAAADGSSGTVIGIKFSAQKQNMYNLSVEDAHTFYVGRGAWLVHNACSRILRKNLGEPDWAENGAVPWQAHHIIPGESESHAFFNRIPGWNIDSADNGIALPARDEDALRLGLPAHRGYHSSYSSRVNAELDDLNTVAETEKWSETRCLQELNNLIARLRKSELSGSGHLQ